MSIITCVLIIYSNKIFSGVARESKGGGGIFPPGAYRKSALKSVFTKKMTALKKELRKIVIIRHETFIVTI